MISGFTNRKRFSDLTEQEVLALAISSEEDDASIYRTYAHELRGEYPGSAAVFDGMALEEDSHRQRLIELFRVRFGEVIPLIRREHVAGYYARSPIWLTKNLSLERIRSEASGMEAQAEKFYRMAAARTTDAATRKLLGDLAAAEAGHEKTAERLESRHLSGDVAGRGRRGRAAAVHPDVGSAGVGGVDGWLGLHPRADLCDGLCDAGQPYDVAGWYGGGGGCRDFDGVHRGGA